MKLLIVADSHTIKLNDMNLIKQLDENICDGVVFLGDIQEPILALFCKVFPNKFKIGVLGNHDNFGMFNGLNIENIHKQIVVKEDISFAGFEGSLKYKNSYYPVYRQDEVSEYFKDLNQVDILISHNSPYDINERPNRASEGFQGITNYLKRQNPVYHFHGHQHINQETVLENKTTVIGVYGVILFDVLTGEKEIILEWE